MSNSFHESKHCITADWSGLHDTARAFLEKLNLPTIHPLCNRHQHEDADQSFFDFTAENFGGAPPTAMLDENNQIWELWSNLVTTWYQFAPSLLAISELLFRIFAIIVAPVLMMHFVTIEVRQLNASEMDKSCELKRISMLVIALVASMILLTDAMHVYALEGRTHGINLFAFFVLLAMRQSLIMRHYRKRFMGVICFIVTLSIYLVSTSEGDGSVSSFHHDPGIDIPMIQPGLYHSKNNTLMNEIVNIWPAKSRSYEANAGATPYLKTGDSATLIQFILCTGKKVKYHRVWLQNKEDNEAVALDISFPSNGIHSSEKTVYVLFHGLNGGSDERYVQEFVWKRSQEGHTCIVMVARGLMDTPVHGWNIFHAKRRSDMEGTASALSKVLGPDQLLAGVGYSMGAIVLSSYVAKSGKNCFFDAAISISGGLDMRENMNFKRSIRLWQPILAKTQRKRYYVGKFHDRLRSRLSKEEHIKLMRSTSVHENDLYAVVSYNRFESHEKYNEEVSAIGKSRAFLAESLANKTHTNEDIGDIANVAIPFCVFNALDDPVISWRTLGHNPTKLVNSGSGHILLLLTKTGGHVSWPTGLNPRREGWRFMNDVAANFVNSVEAAKKSITKKQKRV